MYAPTKEQAEADRDAAFAAGVPFGSPSPAAANAAANADAATPASPPRRALLRLRVVSELRDVFETSEDRPAAAKELATLELPPDARVEAVRLAVRDATGVPPALCRLRYAGQALDDAQRTLGHYGVAYWHAKFPHWPLVIARG
jgi:hypothetical protein